MAAAPTISDVDAALTLAQTFVLAKQQSDGSWSGAVESDARVTAFYLNTIANLGRHADDETRALETYLKSQQLTCGGWEAWPGGGPDIDVTTICVLALNIAHTAPGLQARRRAQRWLSRQAAPVPDSFWRGFLALNGYLSWNDLPYLSPRIVTNPDWLHPNIHDFSFLRIAVVCAILMQTSPPPAQSPDDLPVFDAHDLEFSQWLRSWVATCRIPLAGTLPAICSRLRTLDSKLPTQRHVDAALDWLLAHQEQDGSFFSAVHMTSIAILTLHRLDASRFEDQIQSGIDAMRRWHRVEGRQRWQQFTDSTNWDTFLCLDLLAALGAKSDAPPVANARSYVVAAQTVRTGDWSRRSRMRAGRGWGFQRTGTWYPDCDDTVMAVTALLNVGNGQDFEAARDGVRWLLTMQSSNGSWASWDRNDRAWIQIPGGGPWFARDLGCPEITARIVILFSRILQERYLGFDDLKSSIRAAMRRGTRWLDRERQGPIWFGRWFSHYLYGTCHVVEAYRETGRASDSVEISGIHAWLTSVVNADGGFGEAPDSGRHDRFVGAPSTPFHTACALLALIHADAGRTPIAERAVTWLLENQDFEGSWSNKDYFAAGVPGVWYANFALTPTYFAAKSLLLFRNEVISSTTKRGC